VCLTNASGSGEPRLSYLQWEEGRVCLVFRKASAPILEVENDDYAVSCDALQKDHDAQRTDVLFRPNGTQILNASETLLLNVQKNLFALKEFLSRNPQLFHSSPSEPTTSRTLLTEQEAWKVCYFYDYQ
jgi:hypothetical protein